MIQIEDTILRKLIIHRVTNNLENSHFTNNLIEGTSSDEELFFKNLLLKPFLNHSQTFEFNHEISTDYNVLFNLTKSIFEENNFIEQTQNIAKHLVSVTNHHNIKDADLFISYFEEIKYNNSYCDAVGIYKFEDKDSFLETELVNKGIGIKFKKGLGKRKPEKACLVLFTNEYYTILIIDSGSTDTDYWRNNFIGSKTKNDNVNCTTNFLSLTKTFVTKQIEEDFQVSKADKIDFLNKSVDYFKNHETFDKNEFELEVFQDPNIIQSFHNFDNQYRQENSLEISDNFEISAQAVKKQARVFKSVLKLDKNFHIYIHGDKELIEQGIDEDGRKFYKIYYEQEI